MPNKKSATRLSANILNYFAAFTETRFNFRTLINYRWTDNELTLDLGIFQDFQDELLQRIKSGDSAPITIKNNEHVLSLSGDDVLLEINKALSDKFGLEYLKSCIEREIQRIAERDVVFIATEKGLQAADNADLSEQEIERQNSQAFLDGCRKYNLALRKQIEIILVELQRKQIDRLKYELGIEHVTASTFNPANYLKKHFDALQSIARNTRSQEEYISSVRKYFKEGIDDIVLYDLFVSIQKYARYNTVGTIYLFFHELNRRTDNDAGEGYHTKNPDIVTGHNFSQEYLDYDISRQIELESYGYRFLRLNKFNLRPEQEGETKKDVLDRFLRKAFASLIILKRHRTILRRLASSCALKKVVRNRKETKG